MLAINLYTLYFQIYIFVLLLMNLLFFLRHCNFNFNIKLDVRADITAHPSE